MSMQNWADVSNWKIWLNRMFNILLYLKFNQNSRNYSASPLRRVVKKLIFYEIFVWFTTNPTFPWLGKCQITVVQLFPTCTFFAEKYFPELEINFAFLHWVGEAPCSLQLRVRKTLRLFSTHIFNGSRLCTTACLLGTSRHWSQVLTLAITLPWPTMKSKTSTKLCHHHYTIYLPFYKGFMFRVNYSSNIIFT